MNTPTKGILAAAAAGGLLLGGAGTFALWTSGSAPSVSQQDWADLFVALGLIGYTAAMFVAAFGSRRSRRLGS